MVSMGSILTFLATLITLIVLWLFRKEIRELLSRKVTIAVVGLLVVLILGTILVSPVTKEISTTKSVNETILTPLNVSNATSKIEETKTESVIRSESSSLLPQIVNNLPTILTVLVPLIVIGWFRKEIRELFSRRVTSVKVPGFEIGIADNPEASEIGQRLGLVWRGRLTEMMTFSLFGTANLSEEKIKKLEARIEKNLGEFRKIVIEGISSHQQQKSFDSKPWKDYANLHYEIGKDRLRLADVYNVINKKEEATHQVAEAESNLKTLTEVLSKVNPFMEDIEKHQKMLRKKMSEATSKSKCSMEEVFINGLQNPKFITKFNFNKFIENFDDLLFALDTILLVGICKHLEAYISKSTPPTLLYDAMEQYEKVISYIKKLFGNLFTWDKILTDKDDEERLKKFLELKYNVSWIKTKKFEKIDDNAIIISVL